MTEVELERLVVRLVGDGTEYQKMLVDQERNTAATVRRLESNAFDFEKAGVKSAEHVGHGFEGMEHHAHLSHRAIHMMGHTMANLPNLRSSEQGLEHLGHIGLVVGMQFGAMGVAAGVGIGLAVNAASQLYKHLTEDRRAAGEMFAEVASGAKTAAEGLASIRFDTMKKGLKEAFEPSMLEDFRDWVAKNAPWLGGESAGDAGKRKLQELLKTALDAEKKMTETMSSDVGKGFMREMAKARAPAFLEGIIAKKNAEAEAAWVAEPLREIAKLKSELASILGPKAMKALQPQFDRAEMAVIQGAGNKFLESIDKAGKTAEMSADEIKVYEMSLLGIVPSFLNAAQAHQQWNAVVKEGAGFVREGQKAVESFGLTQGQYLAKRLELVGRGDLSKEVTRIDNLKEMMKVVEENRTPLEKFSDRMNDLNRIFDNGKQHPEAYARAVIKARTELQGMDKVGEGIKAPRFGSAEHLGQVLAARAQLFPEISTANVPIAAGKTTRTEFTESEEFRSMFVRGIEALEMMAGKAPQLAPVGAQ